MEKGNLELDSNGRVRRLDLFGPSKHVLVTDAWLVHLTGLKKLRALEIEHAHVTDQGIETLKLALPKTSFHH